MWFELTYAALFTGLLWIFLCGPYREYRDDLLRQRLFVLRDRLFDAARRGRLEFSHPAYCKLRTLLNGYLLSAEHLSLTYFFLLHRTAANDPELLEFEQRFRVRFDEALATLPGDVRKELVQIRSRATLLLVEHVIMTSPIFWVTVVPVLSVLVVRTLGRSMRDRIHRALAGGRRAETLEFMSVMAVDASEAAAAA